MKIGSEYARHVGVELRRTTGGVMEIRARDDVELARGLGFAHAHDRLTQMALVRLVGQGRLAECLQANEETVAVDIFAREMGFARDAQQDVANLSSEAREIAEAYCQGVNAGLEQQWRPLELFLAGYRPEPWAVADTLATIKIMSYIGLAQSQQDMEKLIIQALRGGTPLGLLRRLLRPHLDGLDEELAARLGELRHVQGLLPAEVRFLSSAPALMASNNWAVAGSRTASGAALQCNDPHLECNRLPAVWYEIVGHTADNYCIGISMPGLPGLVMGRTRHLSAGFTYGFMDMVDYFVEEVRDGQVRRGDAFEPIDERTETIRRKGKAPVEIAVRETSHGVLEADPQAPLEDGLYLCRAWSAQHGGAARSLNALGGFSTARNVEDGCRALRDVTISCNWLLADRDGRIAYQQSGLLPARQHSGLHPVPGWDAAFDWQGLVDPAELLTVVDPEAGFLATANQELNPTDGPLAVNLPMARYRVDRIEALLGESDSLDLDDMQRMQRDLYSLQAERFVTRLEPLMPETRAAEVLRTWDRRYAADSRGATAFERVYAALLREVFGKRVFGLEPWDALIAETGIVVDFHHLFDEVLLGEDDPDWFGEEGRDALFRRVLAAELPEGWEPPPYREQREVVMAHVLLGGRLSFLGYDHGPIVLEGGRATIVQGQIYRGHGRATTFTPSYRYVTDMGRDEAHTALAGGPSGRRFSGWYRTDIERWLAYRYKVLRAE